MDDLKLGTPLRIDQVEFRVQSINNGGYATFLVYKNARVDMERLDDVFGDLWQRKQEFINGRLYCSVGIYNQALKDWVWRQDVGTESNAEKEKGQASDAFKRACFNWGIGRELYSYPDIQVKLNKNEFEEFKGKMKQTWNLKLKEWLWYSEFDGNKITFLAGKDHNGNIRFQWGEMKRNKSATKEMVFDILKKIESKDDSVDGRDAILAKLENETGIGSHEILKGQYSVESYSKIKALL